MRGTFIQDTMMMVNMIILVFLIIFWGMTFGAEKVERLMETSPTYVQQHLASVISVMSTHDGNFTTRLFTGEINLNIVNNGTTVEVSTKEIQYGTDVERGGYTAFKNPVALPFITAQGLEIQERENNYRPNLGQRYIEVAKIGNVIGIGTR